MNNNITENYTENYTENNVQAFVAENGGFITDDHQKEAYKAYREQYKEQYGVMPEFDKVNNPAVALPVSDVLWVAGVKRAAVRSAAKSAAKNTWNITKGLLIGSAAAGMALMGVRGAADKMFEGFGEATAGLVDVVADKSKMDPQLAAEIDERFVRIIDRYKYVYGLAFTGYGVGLEAEESVMNINDGLGWFYDAKSRCYYEGTWVDDEIVFGMAANDSFAFYGDFKNGRPGEGIMVVADVMMQCGKFNDDLEMECEDGFAIKFESGMMWIGPFSGDVMNGMCIAYHPGEGAAKKQEYENGMPKRGLAGWMGSRRGKIDTVKKANARRVEAAKGFINRFVN